MTAPNAQQPAVLPIQTGQIIGDRYLVGEILGYGGMGVICAGTHVLLGTPVAIKLIHSELRDDTEALQRFMNEARAAAALKGEHIARVFDVGLLESGEPYLVMEQLEGMSLDQYLQGREQLPTSEVADIVLQVCEGLAEAHAAGLVHRDIKPANLFWALRPDGHSSIKILDFGIVKWVHAASPRLTDPGKSLGSPWYMSPEQMMTPADVDARSDVWSLGVLLFELLTRRLPFEGESVPEVCANVLAAPAPSLNRYRSDLAPELDAIVQRCLEKERNQRIGSVGELAHQLMPFASVLHAAAYALEEQKMPAAARTMRRPVARRRRAWPRALALAAGALAVLGGWLQYRDPSLAVHAARAAFGANARLAPDAAPWLEVPWPEVHSPSLLQYIHTARAWPEPEREPAGAAPPHRHVEEEQVLYPTLVPPPSPPAPSQTPVALPVPSQVQAPPVQSAVEPPAARDEEAAKRRRDEDRYGL